MTRVCVGCECSVWTVLKCFEISNFQVVHYKVHFSQSFYLWCHLDRVSRLFPTTNDGKLGGGLGMRLVLFKHVDKKKRCFNVIRTPCPGSWCGHHVWWGVCTHQYGPLEMQLLMESSHPARWTIQPATINWLIVSYTLSLRNTSHWIFNYDIQLVSSTNFLVLKGSYYRWPCFVDECENTWVSTILNGEHAS